MIVGGGPVGLTLATDLAWRDIDVIVAERRPPNDQSGEASRLYRRQARCRCVQTSMSPGAATRSRPLDLVQGAARTSTPKSA
jgi:2-polyprenyl-6-methoxyphenol hydroxylase-like FAD-dependent oxidoreductase